MKVLKGSVVDYLLTNASIYPDKTAFTWLDDRQNTAHILTYAELAARVRSSARQFTGKAEYGHLVLLFYQNSYDFIVAFLACQYAGLVPVPLPFSRGKRQLNRLRLIIENAGTHTVLCSAHSVVELANLMENQLDFWHIQDEISVMANATASDKPLNHHTAFVQYTSGSTGTPKGVVVAMSSLIENLSQIQAAFHCNTNSVILSWLPFHHDMGLIGNILNTIFVGCSCFLMQPTSFMHNPLGWLKAISVYRITHSGGPNFAYQYCLDKIPDVTFDDLDLSAWTVAYNGSERVNPRTMRLFSDRFSHVGFEAASFNPCYGLAEATLLVSAVQFRKEANVLYLPDDISPGEFSCEEEVHRDRIREIISCGRPVPGVDVLIAPLKGYANYKGHTIGEICIHGKSITSGYWNASHADNFQVIDAVTYFKTGDIGLLYQSELYILGRLKEMMIIRGRNYYPFDIEAVVSQCNAAIETNGVAVFLVENHLVVVAEIKRVQLQLVNAADVIAAIISAVTDSFGISPDDVLLTTPAGLPKTTSGKIQRLQCARLYLEKSIHVISSARIHQPESELKYKLVLLQEKLKGDPSQTEILNYLLLVLQLKRGPVAKDKIDNRTSLRELGVDSVGAIELINFINSDLIINLDITKVMVNDSVFSLVSSIEKILWLKKADGHSEEIVL